MIALLRPLALPLAAVVGTALLVASTPAQSAPAVQAVITPQISTSHYVRNVTGAFADSGTGGEGCADAKAGSAFVLLDIGAQLRDGTGVALTVVDTRVTYAALRTAIDGYTLGFEKCRAGRTATIAVGTNNDGDFTAFSATNRGRGWADHVIDRLTRHAGLTIVGANDIEAGFAGSELQAEHWETAYLGATTGVLIFNGAASGCPTTVGATKHNCARVRDDRNVVKIWTQAQYYRLAHALHPTRIRALPQIYVSQQATQWANIDATGTRNIPFTGSLTERAACGSCSLTRTAAWRALDAALARIGVHPGRVATDLKIDN